MNAKRIRIIAAITTAIIAAGIISLGQDYQDTVDRYAIDEKTVFAQIQNNEPVLVVDIRTAEQFQAGHLNGASHDDYSDPATLEK